MGTFKMTYHELIGKSGDQTIKLEEDPHRFKGEKVSGTLTIRFDFLPKHKPIHKETGLHLAQSSGDAPQAAPQSAAPVVVKDSDQLGACPVVVEYRDVNKMKHLPVEQLLAEARGGEVYAMLALGIKYGNGEGCHPNDEIALEWYSKAADKGLAEGQFKVGLYHLMGYGTAANDQKAFEWYSKAAAQNNAGACFGLGEIYEGGWGRPINVDEAKRWYSKAAELGDGDAQLSMARLAVAAKDYPSAHEYYHKAALLDFHEAFFELGTLHENGLGVPASAKEALAYYEKAEDLDSAAEAVKRVKAKLSA